MRFVVCLVEDGTMFTGAVFAVLGKGVLGCDGGIITGRGGRSKIGSYVKLIEVCFNGMCLFGMIIYRALNGGDLCGGSAESAEEGFADWRSEGSTACRFSMSWNSS
jgi:hypothetical protein